MTIDAQDWLGEDNHRIVIIDMKYHDGTSFGIKTFSSYPYIMPVGDTFTDLLSNVVSNVSYDDIIASVPNIVSGITNDVSIGQILLNNTDGEYDNLLDNSLTFEGHQIQICIGEPGWIRGDFLVILDGITESVSSSSPDKISISLRDKKEELNVNIQTDLIDTAFFATFMTAADTNGNFTGNITNGSGSRSWNKALAVLPEATENSPIPLCLGKCFNVEPVLIDSYNHIYFVHEGLIESIDEVRANGIVLISGTDYEEDLTLGAFRLLVHDGGSQITCDITGQDGRSSGIIGTPDALTKHSAAYLIEWVLLEKTAITFSDIDQDYFPVTGTNGFDNLSVLGYYSKSEETVLSAVTKIINSVGGYIIFSRSPSTIKIIKFIDPELETPDLYIIADDIVEKGLSIAEIEQPKKSLTIGYKKNWTVQDAAGLAGMITDTNFGFLDELTSYTNEFSTLFKNTTISTTQYPLAEDQEIIESLIYNQSDAQAELDRRVILRNKKRFIYSIKSVASPFVHNIGDIINIVHSRYGFTLGSNGLLISMEESPTNKRVKMEVWI